jgi:hypothetical protein
MIPLASSGQAVVAVVVVLAVALLVWLLRDEARTGSRERPPHER